jgi:hypothetical protein
MNTSRIQKVTLQLVVVPKVVVAASLATSAAGLCIQLGHNGRTHVLKLQAARQVAKGGGGAAAAMWCQ